MTYTLTPPQARLSLALDVQRHLLKERVSAELAALAAAEVELIELLRGQASLPPGDYRLEVDGETVCLVEKEKAPGD